MTDEDCDAHNKDGGYVQNSMLVLKEAGVGSGVQRAQRELKRHTPLPKLMPTPTKTFKLIAISDNTNSFGLYGHILVAQDGEVWQAAAYRGPGGRLEKLLLNETIDVPLENGEGEPNFAALGFEIPNQLPEMPAHLLVLAWPPHD